MATHLEASSFLRLLAQHRENMCVASVAPDSHIDLAFDRTVHDRRLTLERHCPPFEEYN